MFQLSSRSKTSSSRCIIRNTLHISNAPIAVIVQDHDGGIGGASVWITFYKLLEGIDEVMSTEDAKLYASAKEIGTINIFNMVKHLRTKRSKMVHTLRYYSLLYEMVEYYVKNKLIFDKITKQQLLPESNQIQDMRGIYYTKRIHHND